MLFKTSPWNKRCDVKTKGKTELLSRNSSLVTYTSQPRPRGTKIKRSHLMITLSVNKNIVTINIKYSASTRNVDLHSSYTYTTYKYSCSFCFVTVMSDKWIKISSCACVLIISGILFLLSIPVGNYRGLSGYQEEIKTNYNVFEHGAPVLFPWYFWLHAEYENTFSGIICLSTKTDGRPRTPFKRSGCILKTRQCVSTARWCKQGKNSSQQNRAHQASELARSCMSITRTSRQDILWWYFSMTFICTVLIMKRSLRANY